MNKPITITATTPVWLMAHHSADNMLARVRDGKPVTDMLCFWSWDLSKGERPYTKVGEADITIRLFSRDDLVASQMQALQNELDSARAAWLTKQQEIMDRISKLTALTNEVEA